MKKTLLLSFLLVCSSISSNLLVTSNEPQDSSEGLTLVVVEGKYGFRDTKGRIVIAPQFAMARDFAEGLAAVAQYDGLIHAQWGFIDKTGSVVIPYQFKMAMSFSEGLAAVEVAPAVGLVYERTKNRLPSLWGYVNKTGETVIPPQFVAAFPFKEGVARFWTGAIVGQNKYGVIDKTGKEIVKPNFDDIGDDFHEGLAPFRLGSKWGFIDTSGKVVIEPRFDGARGFSEGLGRVALKNKWSMPEWGFIDRTGKIVIKPEFESTGDFSEGLAWVRPYSKAIGYIDTNGKMVIKPKFASAENFSGGLALVGVQGNRKFVEHGTQHKALKYGYIDRTGRYVRKPTG